MDVRARPCRRRRASLIETERPNHAARASPSRFHAVANLLRVLSLARLDILRILPLDCFASFHTEFRLLMATLLAVNMVAYWRWSFEDARREAGEARRLACVWMGVNYALYLPISNAILRSMICTSAVAGERRLDADLTVSCDGVDHNLDLVIASFAIVGYIIALPCAFLGLLRRHRVDESFSPAIFITYERCWYAEPLVLLEKASFVLCATYLVLVCFRLTNSASLLVQVTLTSILMMIEPSYGQLIAGIAISIAWFWLFAVVRPCGHVFSNVANECCHLMISAVLFCALLAKSFDSSNDVGEFLTACTTCVIMMLVLAIFGELSGAEPFCLQFPAIWRETFGGGGGDGDNRPCHDEEKKDETTVEPVSERLFHQDIRRPHPVKEGFLDDIAKTEVEHLEVSVAVQKTAQAQAAAAKLTAAEAQVIALEVKSACVAWHLDRDSALRGAPIVALPPSSARSKRSAKLVSSLPLTRGFSVSSSRSRSKESRRWAKFPMAPTTRRRSVFMRACLGPANRARATMYPRASACSRRSNSSSHALQAPGCSRGCASRRRWHGAAQPNLTGPGAMLTTRFTAGHRAREGRGEHGRHREGREAQLGGPGDSSWGQW